MACVMASDSQIMALGTMFTQDIFKHYEGAARFGDKAQIWTARVFVVLITLTAYLIAMALKAEASIFELAIRFAFSGFAALAPIMVAALFWKRSTKWGALAAAIWVVVTLLASWYLFQISAGIAPKPGQPPVPIFPALGNLFLRTPGNVTVYGYLPVMPMCIGSAIIMWLVSLLTPPPSQATLDRYFPRKGGRQDTPLAQPVAD
jgi:SSS family solute:Na+ symporter